MALLQTLFYTFIALGVLVTIHEFGHFWVARRCGVKVERFSIGFGTPLLRWRDKQDTEFVLALLPLGGYVKMLDEREGNVSEEDRPFSFNSKTVWQRIAIVAAGPIANFLLAFLAFWLIFLAGERDLAPVVLRSSACFFQRPCVFHTGRWQEVTNFQSQCHSVTPPLNFRAVIGEGRSAPL